MKENWLQLQYTQSHFGPLENNDLDTFELSLTPLVFNHYRTLLNPTTILRSAHTHE